MKKIRVLVVDDYKLVRSGIQVLLQNVQQIEIVGSVSSGEEAINTAQEEAPDVILMDIVLRGMSGIETTRWIKEQNPEIKIILLSSEISKDYLTTGIKAGINGYLHKDVEMETLVEAIKTVAGGGKFFNEAITNLVFKDFVSEVKGDVTAKPMVDKNLTKREHEILTLVAMGKSNKEVAEELFISTKTVETHKTHILEKLGLRNTAELVRYAIAKNLIPLTD